MYSLERNIDTKRRAVGGICSITLIMEADDLVDPVLGDGFDDLGQPIIDHRGPGEVQVHELAEIMSSLCPDVLRRIACLVNEGLANEQLLWNDEEIGRKDRRRESVLTKRERDVLALVGRGLTNREIAETLYMCNGTVRTFLYRACAKLGASNRLDAIVLALKRGDIMISEVLSLNELLENLPYMSQESLEKIAQLRSQNFSQEPVVASR